MAHEEATPGSRTEFGQEFLWNPGLHGFETATGNKVHVIPIGNTWLLQVLHTGRAGMVKNELRAFEIAASISLNKPMD